MKKKLYYIVWLFAVLFIVGCEDLEDTYDEYAGNGRIHYVGKCSNLEVLPGWKRLKVKWKGNLDANIDHVKVTWKAESDSESHVLFLRPKDVVENNNLVDSCYLENLANAVYTVTVSNISVDSTESIVESAYARPYTESHEDLQTFTRGIINFYPLNGRLAVILDDVNENISEMNLVYWGSDGEQHTWNIKEHMGLRLSLFGEIDFGRDYYFLIPGEGEPGIDFSKEIKIQRKGKLPNCIDEINFEDATLLKDEQVWSAGFSQLLLKQYGGVTDEIINSVETIELDYDMASFQDLLYFPNLKKVILGKNRYMIDGYTSMNVSTTDVYKGLLTLQFLKDSREGFTVERYNNHYFGNDFESVSITTMVFMGKIKPGLLSEMKNTNTLPKVVPLDTTGWEVTCTDTVYNGYKTNGAANLLIDDPKFYFEPGLTSSVKVFEVKFDMKKPMVVKGFKIVQPTQGTQTDIKYLLPSLKIEVSKDGYEWENATYENGGINIGNTPGETTFIYVPEVLQKSVQYVRLTIVNQYVNASSDGSPLFSLRLGAFIPF